MDAALNNASALDWKHKVRELELRLDEAKHRIRVLEGIIGRSTKRIEVCLDTLKSMPVAKD